MTNQKPICRKVYVNRAGYAYSGMKYFGNGHQLWYVEFTDGTSGHVRAQSRKEAIAEAKQQRNQLTVFETARAGWLNRRPVNIHWES